MEIKETNTNMTNQHTVQYQADFSSFTGNWMWKAVLCLVEIPEFNPSPKWVASRLNITIDNAVEALEGLERLNLIKKQNNTLVVTDDFFQVNKSNFNEKTLLKNSAELMQQAITKIGVNDKYTVQFFLADQDLINEYSTKFWNLYKEIEKKGKQKGCTDVVISQLAFSVLTQSKQNGDIQ